jgi:hypothetical protein
MQPPGRAAIRCPLWAAGGVVARRRRPRKLLKRLEEWLGLRGRRVDEPTFGVETAQREDRAEQREKGPTDPPPLVEGEAEHEDHIEHEEHPVDRPEHPNPGSRPTRVLDDRRGQERQEAPRFDEGDDLQQLFHGGEVGTPQPPASRRSSSLRWCRAPAGAVGSDKDVQGLGSGRNRPSKSAS